MGAFSKALKNAQYLQPLAQSLVQYKQRMQEDEGRKQLLAIIQRLPEKSNEYFQRQEEQKATFEPNLEVQNRMDAIRTKRPQYPDGITNNVEGIPTSQGTTPIKPPTQVAVNQIGENKPAYDPSTNSSDYRTYLGKIMPEVANAITEGLTNKNIDPQTLMALTDVFTKFGMPQAPPTSTIEKWSPEDNVYLNTQGKLTPIQTGTGKTQDYSEYEKNLDGTLKTYTNPEGGIEYNKITYSGKTGKVIKEDREQLPRKPVGNFITNNIINPADNLGKLTEGYSAVDRLKQIIENAKPNEKTGKIRIKVDGRDYYDTPKNLRTNLVDKEKSKYKGYARELLFNARFENVYEKMEKFGAENLAKYDFDTFLEKLNEQQVKKGLQLISDPNGVLETAYNFYRM
jgi:hypothetical protein